MYFYEVLVVQEYVGRESVFTYSSEFDISPFNLVLVPLQNKSIPGIIVRKTQEPAFKTKLITSVSVHKLGLLQRHLVRFIADYYAASEAQALQLFIPSFLEKLAKKAPDPIEARPDFPSLPLVTVEQTEALRILRSHPAETTVLHGETGSGKTRIYLERAHDVVGTGKSMLIMTPEIALVPQLVKQFKAAFGDMVFAYHSQLTVTKRAEIWQRIALGQQVIIIGTRSALFLPFVSLGLVILDESHEPAYKQEEGVRYHATRIASVLAGKAGAQLILGSATPLVSDMYLAQERHKAVARLLSPAITSDKTNQTIVIDMKERDEFSRHQLLSITLLKEIGAALQRGEQSLVYLNRRGTARLILCSVCGWQAMCPICNIALTYHQDVHQLRCHTCGYHESVPNKCPVCSSTDIVCTPSAGATEDSYRAVVFLPRMTLRSTAIVRSLLRSQVWCVRNTARAAAPKRLLNSWLLIKTLSASARSSSFDGSTMSAVSPCVRTSSTGPRRGAIIAFPIAIYSNIFTGEPNSLLFGITAISRLGA